MKIRASQTVIDQLGWQGRMLSGSKSAYADKNPNRVVLFNGNLYDAEGCKLWYGDMDLTADAKRLTAIAEALGEEIYVTYEMPFRFNEPTLDDLKKACVGDHPRAFVIRP